MKVLARAVLAAAVVLIAPTLQAQTSFSVAAGATMPVGDTGDGFDMGYHATVGLGIKPPLAPVGFRGEVMYSQMESKVFNNIGSRVVAGIANVTYTLAPQIYAIGGLGMYNGSCTGSACPAAAESSNDFGFNIGGGVNVPLTGLGVYIEARLHVIDDTKIIPISVGLKF
jgi:hypothetical protein